MASPAAIDAGVIVAVRCRPQNDREEGEQQAGRLTTDTGASCVAIHDDEDGDGESQAFEFDKVYDADTKQSQIYEDLGKPLVDRAFEWYNGTIFAYGQTGSGKTHSMLGPDEANPAPEDVGIIPRLVDDVFQRAAVRNRLAMEDTPAGEPQVEYVVKCTYLEIYQERVVDLLTASRPPHMGGNPALRIRSHPETGCYVEGALEPAVGSVGEMRQLMREGDKRRRVASHSLNDRSSRSHAVFTIKLFQVINTAGGRQVHQNWSRINLCDLAGSERQKDTHAEGVRLVESSNINRGLLTLQRVIAALAKNTRPHQQQQQVVVPFRESKLTQLLSESLGGSALCSMLACVSPAAASLSQTVSTLKYARSARLIKLHVAKNRELLEVDLLKGEVEELRRQMEQARADEQGALVQEYEARMHGLQQVIGRAAAAQQDYKKQLREERRRALAALSTPARIAEGLKGTPWGDLAGRILSLEGELAGAEAEYHQQRRFVRRLEAEMQGDLDAFKGAGGGGERELEGMLVKLRTVQGESARLKGTRERIRGLYQDLVSEADAQADALRAALPEEAVVEAAAHAEGTLQLSLGGSTPLSPSEDLPPATPGPPPPAAAWEEEDELEESGEGEGEEGGEGEGAPSEVKAGQAALVHVLELRLWASQGVTRLRRAEGHDEGQDFSIPDLLAFVTELPEAAPEGDGGDVDNLGSAKLAWGDTRALDLLGYASDVIEKNLTAVHARKAEKMEDLLAENQRLQEEAYRQQQLLDMKDAELRDVWGQVDDVNYTVEAANHEIDVLVADLGAARDRAERAEEAAAAAKGERQALEVRGAEAEAEAAVKARESAMIRAERDALEAKLAEVVAGQVVDGKSSEVLRAALADVETDKASIVGEVRDLRGDVESREKELAAGRVALHAREAEVAELQRALRAKEEEAEGARARQDAAVQDLSAARGALAAAEARLANLQDSEKLVLDKERELAGLKGRSEAEGAERERLLEQLRAAEGKAETIDAERRRALLEAEAEKKRAEEAQQELEVLKNAPPPKSKGCAIM